MTDYKIYCMTHVPAATPDDRLYTLLQTGRAFDGFSIDGIIGDDTGDNISRMKYTYDGVMTGIYWVWKNTDHDIVGVSTYRRYIETNDGRAMNLDDIKWEFEENGTDFIACLDTSPTQERLLQMGDYLKGFNCTPQLFHNFLFNPWALLRDVIRDHCSEYTKAFDCISGGYAANWGLIFIARKKYFNSFCEWMFGLLEKFEIYLQRRGYPYPYFARFMSLISEPLMRVWLIMQPIKIVERPIHFMHFRDGVNYGNSFDKGRNDLKDIISSGYLSHILYNSIF